MNGLPASLSYAQLVGADFEVKLARKLIRSWTGDSVRIRTDSANWRRLFALCGGRGGSRYTRGSISEKGVLVQVMTRVTVILVEIWGKSGRFRLVCGDCYGFEQHL